MVRFVGVHHLNALIVGTISLFSLKQIISNNLAEAHANPQCLLDCTTQKDVSKRILHVINGSMVIFNRFSTIKPEF